ncbi:MAG TPA: aminomethyl-transferring glycine dehydrogenase subunit GcvPA [Chloroflexota bacterium]|nr:aminomethyl-transferring glycine dehydrogenase subunit GcvPA [Chloroflexota bacterium]
MSYLPHTAEDRRDMLAAIGVDNVDELFANVPEELRSGPLAIPAGISEMEVLDLVEGMAQTNLNLTRRPAFLGAGAYRHFVPSAVAAITGRSEFYTSYTPYQAEVSQGTLQVIYEYQTMMAELTGLDVSNASLYDAATAVAEASKIAINQTRRDRILILPGVHPEYREVLQTYLRAENFELVESGGTWQTDLAALDATLDTSIAGVVAQSPNFFGAIEPMAGIARRTHDAGALFIAVANPLSLGILAPPGEYDADIAVGCGQPLGIPLMYGGPYLGFIAARAGLERRLPGRIAGATVDMQGRRGYVLTLQAREQHIRREKATSNICTNHALMALAATVYLSLLGKQGIREVAALCAQKAHFAASHLVELPGFSLAHDLPFFNEVVLRTPVPAAEINRFLLDRGIVGGFDLGRFYPDRGDCLLLAFTEMTARQHIDDLIATLASLEPVSIRSEAQQLQGAGSRA